MDYSRELDVALAAAAKAGDYFGRPTTRSRRSQTPRRRSAPRRTGTSQEMILSHLAAAFPDDALCAEEATATLKAARREGSRLWVVDPIDGTRGFVMKNGEFSVMIGLVDRGRVVVGRRAWSRHSHASRTHRSAADAGFGPATNLPLLATSRSTEKLDDAVLVQSHAKQGEDAVAGRGPEASSVSSRRIPPASSWRWWRAARWTCT